MRERQSDSEGDSPDIGITPAYAGKTKVREPNLLVSKDHPRVCGKDPRKCGKECLD